MSRRKQILAAHIQLSFEPRFKFNRTTPERSTNIIAWKPKPLSMVSPLPHMLSAVNKPTEANITCALIFIAFIIVSFLGLPFLFITNQNGLIEIGINCN